MMFASRFDWQYRDTVAEMFSNEDIAKIQYPSQRAGHAGEIFLHLGTSGSAPAGNMMDSLDYFAATFLDFEPTAIRCASPATTSRVWPLAPRH
jgi:hypothetical protein